MKRYSPQCGIYTTQTPLCGTEIKIDKSYSTHLSCVYVCVCGTSTRQALKTNLRFERREKQTVRVKVTAWGAGELL